MSTLYSWISPVHNSHAAERKQCESGRITPHHSNQRTSQYTRRALCAVKHTPARCIPVTRTSRTQFFIALLKKGHHRNFWHLQSKMQNISCASTAFSNINSKPCVTVLFLKGLAECSAWWAPSSCNYLISYFFSSDLFWHRAETTDSTA